MNFGGDHPAHGHGKISPRCVPKLPAMARYRPDAFPGCRPWQDCALMRSQAAGHGKKSSRCVPALPAVARLRPDAFPGCRPWQDCAPMRSRRGLRREKHRFAATYRLHAFKFSSFWQDMRAMHPKSPAERRWGMHRASILPPRGAFAVRSPQIMHGARILPPSGGPAPAQGLLPEQPHRGIAFQRLGPCPGGGAYPPAPRQYPPPADTRHLPMPAACRARCSQGQAADGLRRRSFGAWPAVRPSLEGPPTASSRRAGRQRNAAQSWAWIPEPWTSGRRTSGGGRRPGRSCASAAKTPIERTSPSWRNYRSTPPTRLRTFGD